MSEKYTPKPDSGTLFKNGFKKNETHPDYTGTYAMPDGTIREMAAWVSETGYLSVRFSNQYNAVDKSVDKKGTS